MGIAAILSLADPTLDKCFMLGGLPLVTIARDQTRWSSGGADPYRNEVS